MIGAIVALLLMQLIGTLIVQFTHIPLPGPVLGMLLLFVYLLRRGKTPKDLTNTSKALLDNLSLLFVPAGVGIIVYWPAISGQFWQIAIVLVLSALITILATAYTLHWLLKRKNT